MKIKLKIKSKKNLYEYWKKILTDALLEEIQSGEHKFVVNLASNEYSKAIDLKSLGVPVLTIKFQQKTPNGMKSKMLPVKQARGMMMKYLAANQISQISEIKKFSNDGYKFYAEEGGVIIFVTDSR